MLAFLLGLVVIILLVLAMPVDVAFHVSSDDISQSGLSLCWGFGLLRKDVGKKNSISAKLANRQMPPIFQSGVRTKHGKSAMVFLRTPGMPARLLRLAGDFLRQLRVQQFHLHLSLGLDDPADTGRLYGALSPVVLLVACIPNMDFRVWPDFSQAVFQAKGQGQLRVIPLAVLWVILGFLASPTFWRAVSTTTRSGKR